MSQTQENVIIWIILILIVLLCTSWVLPKITGDHILQQKQGHDMEELQQIFNAACKSKEYLRKYNPVTEEGNISLNGSIVCITAKTTQCRELFCDTEVITSSSFTDKTYIVVQKDAAFVISTE